MAEQGLGRISELAGCGFEKIRRINNLIKDIQRNGADVGIGNPEPLKGELSGFYSRHIDKENRLVYYIANNDGEELLVIASCKGHYNKR